MKEIKVLLLQGGTEVIAEVETLTSVDFMSGTKGSITGYRLNKPYRIFPVPLPMQTPQGININVIPNLIPLMGATIQSFIVLKPSDIIGDPMDANQQFRSAYIKQTTGLEIASSLQG